MREFGMLMWILGIALGLFAAFGFDPSVATGVEGFERVINLQRQSQQMMMLGAAALMVVIGVAIHIASAFMAQPSDSDYLPSKRNVNEVTVTRLAYARQIGISVDADSYSIDGKTFTDLEDAISYTQENRT